MHSARVVLLMLLFTLAAVGAFAQTAVITSSCCPTVGVCPSCPSGVTTPSGAGPACPAACPAPEPVCPPTVTIPQPVAAQPACSPNTPCGEACGVAPTCPTVAVMAPTCSIAGGIGAGALSTLQAACAGPDFDRAYIEQMYTLHAQIIALTSQGVDQATDRNLRDLSSKIRNEQTDQNKKLAMWYGQMGCGALSPAVCGAGPVSECLCRAAAGPQFDTVYATTLTDTLVTLRDAAQIGSTKLTNAEVRNQAELVARVSQNEITALQRWIANRGLTY